MNERENELVLADVLSSTPKIGVLTNDGVMYLSDYLGSRRASALILDLVSSMTTWKREQEVAALALNINTLMQITIPSAPDGESSPKLIIRRNESDEHQEEGFEMNIDQILIGNNTVTFESPGSVQHLTLTPGHCVLKINDEENHFKGVFRY